MTDLHGSVARLAIHPGDTLMVSVDRPLTQEQRERLAATVRNKLPRPGNVLVVEIPAKFTVLADGSQLFGHADAEAVLDEAGQLIWHSMRKFDGDPSRVDYHAISCGCTECN